MIEMIQIILDALGIVFCAIGAVCTGEIGYVVATIWAVNALVSHIQKVIISND